MIAWKKLGLVFDATELQLPWAANSALTPTPFRLNDEVVRVYAGFRDRTGVSRVGYVDIDMKTQGEVVGVSRKPVLDIGRNGCFDDNGVILGDVVRRPEGIYMFYVGFQLVAKAKFLAFSGVALSIDGGDTFSRMSEAPILERAKGQTTIGAIHSVRYEDGRWRIWYASGDGWEYIDGKPFPQYHIRYVETDDLFNIPRRGNLCIDVQGDEYRIGRPRVYRMDGKFVMYFTKGTIGGVYFPGVAYSEDGVKWIRNDNDFGLSLSPSGWDSRTLCYPSLINVDERLFMFYNGNDMGANGFGCAEAAKIRLE